MITGFIDYTDKIGFDCVYAHISNGHVLVLEELATPHKRMDNSLCKYVLKYGVVVFGGSTNLDEAQVVLSHNTYYNLSELKSLKVLGTGGIKLEGVNLFNHFSIC